MIMTDIFARRNSINKNKLLQKKSVAAYSIQNSPNFNLSILAPDICLYESIRFWIIFNDERFEGSVT